MIQYFLWEKLSVLQVIKNNIFSTEGFMEAEISIDFVQAKLMLTKNFKDEIGFIENDSYQLNLLIENLVHSKQHKANCLLKHKIIKKNLTV